MYSFEIHSIFNFTNLQSYRRKNDQHYLSCLCGDRDPGTDYAIHCPFYVDRWKQWYVQIQSNITRTHVICGELYRKRRIYHLEKYNIIKLLFLINFSSVTETCSMTSVSLVTKDNKSPTIYTSTSVDSNEFESTLAIVNGSTDKLTTTTTAAGDQDTGKLSSPTLVGKLTSLTITSSQIRILLSFVKWVYYFKVIFRNYCRYSDIGLAYHRSCRDCLL